MLVKKSRLFKRCFPWAGASLALAAFVLTHPLGAQLAPYYALTRDVKTCKTHQCQTFKWTLSKSTVFRVLKKQPKSYLLQLRTGQKYWVPSKLLMGSYIGLTPSRSEEIKKLKKRRQISKSRRNIAQYKQNREIEKAKKKLDYFESLPPLKKMDPWLLNMDPLRPGELEDPGLWKEFYEVPIIGPVLEFLYRFRFLLPYVLILALIPFVNWRFAFGTLTRFRAISKLLGILGMKWCVDKVIEISDPETDQELHRKNMEDNPKNWSRPNAADPERINLYGSRKDSSDPIMEEIIYNLDYEDYKKEVESYNKGEVTLPSGHLKTLKDTKQEKKIGKNTMTHISVTILKSWNTKALKLAEFLAKKAEDQTEILQNSLDELEQKQKIFNDEVKNKIDRYKKNLKAEGGKITKSSRDVEWIEMEDLNQRKTAHRKKEPKNPSHGKRKKKKIS